MEVLYKSDLYASHMQIAIPPEINRKQYVFQMLEENSIKGILPVKQRIEEGHPYLYLDITAKRNLVRVYQDREMELEDLTGLLQELIVIFDELRNYLLPDKFLLLEPEYIFRDTETGELSLALLPWEREEGRELQRLAEFFLEKMNTRDEHGVNAAYLLYRQQSRQGFSLYRFMPVVERENILKRQKKKENTPPEEERIQNYSEAFPTVEEANVLQEQEYVKKKSKKGEKKRTGVADFLRSLFTRRRKGAIIGEDFMLMENRETGLQKEYDYSQETVFFEEYGEDKLMLQWKEKGRAKKAELSPLPLTIGKLVQEVSVVMEDGSVSRIHCRFIEQENGIGIMDMNSTNGTYLNGMRLKPGEIMGIAKNDEILVGKVRVLVV